MQLETQRISRSKVKVTGLYF